MGDVPGWWQALAEFAAARHHPGGAVAILRRAGLVLLADPSASPRKIADGTTRPDGTPTAEGRALAAFFTDRGLTMPGDQAGRRAAARRQRYLDALPAGLAAAVAAFNDAQLAERERDRRAGRRLLSDVTLETRLRILRDLARRLAGSGPITGWAEVTTADLEGFLAGRARNRHQETYVLRRYFAWARQRRLILIDPARPLRLGSQPGFTGTVLDADAQRSLLSRWTSDGTHPHERLAGLLALLHAASSAEIRSLAVTGVDDRKRTVMLPGRPFPVPADPATWDAVLACLRYRDQLATLNPHLIVTKATRTGNAPADGSYLTRRLAPAGVTPSACRQTRIAQFVNDLDPKLTAAALGMQDSGLVRYLADNVDKDRLHRLTPR
jgi:site-specific recombinase XerC